MINRLNSKIITAVTQCLVINDTSRTETDFICVIMYTRSHIVARKHAHSHTLLHIHTHINSHARNNFHTHVYAQTHTHALRINELEKTCKPIY